MLLEVLDLTSVVHALGFLKTLNDLINTASTCTAAEILIRENWTAIKPEAEILQKRFVDQLEPIGTAFLHGCYYETCNKPEAVPRLLQDATPPYHRTLCLIAHEETILPLMLGQALTKLQLIGLTEHGVEVKLNAGGTPLISIPAAVVNLFRGEDGSLELMQFLKHLTLAQWHDVKIWCSEDATLVTTEHPCRFTSGHWVVDQVMFNVYDFLDKPLPLYLNFTTDYIAVIFRHREQHSKWLTESVKHFTLVLNNTRFAILGWACRKKTAYQGSAYYEIPVQRQVNFSRVEKCTLEVEFHAEPSVFLQAIVVARTQNVLVHNGMMMGHKFNS
jgi:hypothetical protein